MPAQCRLPTRPRKKAVQSSMRIQSNAPDHHRFIEEVILASGSPLDAHFPQSRTKGLGIEPLCAFRINGELHGPVQAGVRWTVQLNGPARLLPSMSWRQCQGAGLLG